MSIMGYGWRKFLSPLYRLIGDNSKVSLGKGLIIYGIPALDVCAGAKIEIGSGVILCSKSNYTALGVSKPIIFRAIAPGAVISVGNNSGFSGTVIVAAQEVRIGNDCLIGADVLICDNDFHPINPEGRRLAKSGVKSSPVVIGDNVFVGTRSTILKGARIGANSVIGAGSVVVGEIPANVVAAGNPAKVIRTLQAASAAEISSDTLLAKGRG